MICLGVIAKSPLSITFAQFQNSFYAAVIAHRRAKICLKAPGFCAFEDHFIAVSISGYATQIQATGKVKNTEKAIGIYANSMYSSIR